METKTISLEESIWIQCGNIKIYIKHNVEGVSIDAYSINSEDEPREEITLWFEDF